ncbi:hypothetical protein IQ63_01570 [Streptomyces acidiscabies]|uniref:DUF397 domain-containing protein n=1 Tax=Streptomyces acidiscabies TaxID=42234 RepID=A0A0L0KQM3_9ACTN|nr:hypothetical protein IQ63_01570 [Streptomyces acidiscabies]
MGEEMFQERQHRWRNVKSAEGRIIRVENGQGGAFAVDDRGCGGDCPLVRQGFELRPESLEHELLDVGAVEALQKRSSAAGGALRSVAD